MKKPISPVVIRLTIFLTLAFFAVLSVKEITTSADQRDRQPASEVTIHKMKHTKKLISPLKVQIKATSDSAKQAGDRYSLKAIVTSSVDVKDIQVTWKVPESSKIISGDLAPHIQELRAGESKEFVVLLEQVTNENSQIHVGIVGRNDMSNFGFTAQYNSLDQELINDSINALHERSKKYQKNLETSKND